MTVTITTTYENGAVRMNTLVDAQTGEPLAASDLKAGKTYHFRADQVNRMPPSITEGRFYLMGDAGTNGPNIVQWEHWLTLSRVIVIGKTRAPKSINDAERAIHAFMERVRMADCDGCIVATSRHPDGRPYMAFNEYALIMELFTQNKDAYVLTTDPLCESHLVASRTETIDCLDPDGPRELYRYTWEDFRSQFDKKKISPDSIAA